MRHNLLNFAAAAILSAVMWQTMPLGSDSAEAGHGWDGKRQISYQHQKDLFYNYYAQPGPYNGAAAGMYPAPLPVPPHVGHTYVTYQPFMPHEYLYKHHRSYYTYNRGAGWTRTNVRYGTGCLRMQNWWAELHYPRSNNITAVFNDLHHPGLRF